MKMAAEKHFLIRAYLRQHGKDDMSKYNPDWIDGETRVEHWGYEDVPAPTAESLLSVPSRWIDYETETLHT